MSVEVKVPGPNPGIGQNGQPGYETIVVEGPKQAQVASGQEQTTW
jgi:hypothetical protein